MTMQQGERQSVEEKDEEGEKKKKKKAGGRGGKRENCQRSFGCEFPILLSCFS